MKRVELEPSFVLHHRPYRETSLLVEAFARDTGRLGLIAKGARRPKSDLRGLLQPFRPLLLSWSGRGELALLTAAEPYGYVRGLAGKALFSGFYMNELLMRLLHRFDPHPELFHHYRAALEALAEAEHSDESMDGRGRATQEAKADESMDGRGRATQEAKAEAVLRVFEKRMLESIGYGLVLDHDIESGEPIDAGATYRYERERGPVLHTDADAAGLCVAGETLLALAAEAIDAERALDEAKRLMRTVLRGYLGDKPLATRTLFRPSPQESRASPVR